MRAAIWEGPSEQVIKDIPAPELEPGEVLVKVKDVGICGSDLFSVTNKNVRVRPPMVLGHEISGTVDKLGPGVPGSCPQVGTKVGLLPLVYCGTCPACRSGNHNLCSNFKLLGHQIPGAFAEYIKVPYDRLIPIPESVNWDQAFLLEPVAVAVHAFSLVVVRPGDEIIILGGGPIGILCAEMARIQGASKVVVTDITDFRLDVIRKMGFIAVDGKADNVNDVLLNHMDGPGADIVVEAVGSHQTALQMAYLGKPNGQILVVGMHKGQPPVDLRQLAFGEQPVIAARLYKDEDFVRASRLLASGMVNTSFLGNVRMPLDEINEGFEVMRQASETLKVAIDLSL